MKRLTRFLGLTAVCASLMGLSACALNDEMSYNVAKKLATPAWMIDRQIETGPFVLTAYERMYERGEPANIYISGDGNVDIVGEDTALFEPTPQNPVALHLATKDKADNLAYLARPCQYTDLRTDSVECEDFWGENKYNPAVLAGLNEALDGIKRRYTITGFNLIGYDDGATVAAILATQRSDVMSLRTVAGHFDEQALAPVMADLRNVPQHHFTGGQDQQTPPAHLQMFLQRLGESDCVDHTFIQEATHDAGWVDKWPELLKSGVPHCYVAPEPDFSLIETPEPIYAPRIGIEKK